MTALMNLPPANVSALPSYRARPVALETMDDALRYAKVIAASGLLPASFLRSDADPTAAAFVAIQLGAEVGLSPMASVQNIAVINGKPGLYGPAMLAVVEASGKLENFEEWIEGEGDKMVAHCRVKRFGRPERLTSFSWDDAKKAQLTGKRGPWTEYPKRMMQARARSFALRDVFPDVLAGLSQSVEELADIPADPQPPAPSIEASDQAIGQASLGPRLGRSKMNTPAPKPPLEVVIGDGWDPAKFPRTKKGLTEALAFITGAVLDGKPGVVALNNGLLDTIAERMPELADEISGLRAAAAEALAPVDEPEPEPEDDFPGDFPPEPASSLPPRS